MQINPYMKAISFTEPEKNLKSMEKDMNNRVAFNPVKQVFNQVNNSQLQADQSQQAFAVGEADSIHKVILDMEDALMSMKLATQVRNRLVEAYQDVMRMQV